VNKLNELKAKIDGGDKYITRTYPTHPLL